MSQRRRATTAVDLILVLFIVALLIAFLAVAVSKAKGFANNNDQKANLRNLATACRVAEVESNRLPPIWAAYGRPPQGENKPRVAGVFVHLLPYLEQKALFDAGDFDQVRVRVFASAMDSSTPPEGKGYTSFVANLRSFSSHGMNTAHDASIDDLSKCRDGGGLTTEKFNDGAGNTVLFVTKYAECNGVANKFYLAPDDKSKGGPYFGAGNHIGKQLPAAKIPVGTTKELPAYQIAPVYGKNGEKGETCNNDAGLFGHSFGAVGLAVAMGDSSVRNISFMVTGTTFARAIHPSDGLALGADW